MEISSIPGQPLNETDYIRGWDDGVEYVLDLMHTFINHSVIAGCEPWYIRVGEEMLEDVQNTLDNE